MNCTFSLLVIEGEVPGYWQLVRVSWLTSVFFFLLRGKNILHLCCKRKALRSCLHVGSYLLLIELAESNENEDTRSLSLLPSASLSLFSLQILSVTLLGLIYWTAKVISLKFPTPWTRDKWNGQRHVTSQDKYLHPTECQLINCKCHLAQKTFLSVLIYFRLSFVESFILLCARVSGIV